MKAAPRKGLGPVMATSCASELSLKYQVKKNGPARVPSAQAQAAPRAGPFHRFHVFGWSRIAPLVRPVMVDMARISFGSSSGSRNRERAPMAILDAEVT